VCLCPVSTTKCDRATWVSEVPILCEGHSFFALVHFAKNRQFALSGIFLMSNALDNFKIALPDCLKELNFELLG
jgi:hypothetical protein